MFLEYIATNGRQYAIHPRQICGFEGNDKETIVRVSMVGVPLNIRLNRPYKEVIAEWRQAVEKTEEAP